MIFLGNGEFSQDMVNDRIIQFLDLITHLSGLQQGFNSKKVLNEYNRRANKFARQIKFDLLTNKIGDLKLYNSPEYLQKVRTAFEQLDDALGSAAREERSKWEEDENEERNIPF